jgi:hypothetical protein
VLRHTQVHIQPDGELHQENNRISFRISPNLEGDERYNYLLSRLTLKPRWAHDGGAEEKEAATTEKRTPIILSRSGRQRQATPSVDSLGSLLDRSPSPTPMEGVEGHHQQEARWHFPWAKPAPCGTRR